MKIKDDRQAYKDAMSFEYKRGQEAERKKIKRYVMKMDWWQEEGGYSDVWVSRDILDYYLSKKIK